ncbi:MAG: MATE family efflux transporter [Oleiphilaceae bacterium]|nr:MATE family efflux transporter [Oleiphilaceae bacterium]
MAVFSRQRVAVGALDRRLWALAWPLMLTQITVPLLGLADTAVLGHLDDSRYLAAVAVGANLFTVLFWAFGFLRMGTTGLAAQAYGRQRPDELVALLLRSVLISLLLAAGLVALQQPLIATGLRLMKADPAVTVLAAEYAAIRIWSAPAVLVQYTLIGWLIGTQHPRGPLLILVLANSLNIVLDVLFVTVFGWHSRGVAMATVMAEYSGCGLALWLVWRRLPGVLPQPRWLLGTWQDYRAILSVNRFILVRTLLLLFTFAFFTAQGARAGETIVAANAVLLTFLLIISNGLDGFAHAAEALVGEARGRRDRQALDQTAMATLKWSLIGAALFTLAFILGGHWLIQGLTSIEPVRATAIQYLPWIWLMPLIAVWGYAFDGIFIGATRTRAMQNTMALSVLGVFLPVWWLTQGWGNQGLWLAFMSFLATRGLAMAGLYRYWQRHGGLF